MSGAWLRALLLVPAVFVLAIAAVGLAITTASRALPPAEEPAGQTAPQAASPELVLPVTIPPSAGNGPVDVTARITTDPPVSASILEGSRTYLTALLRSLVDTLPPGWTPTPDNLDILRLAIEDAVPVSLAPSLPEGTQVAVDVTIVTHETPPPLPSSP
jgi:hypothetical protein